MNVLVLAMLKLTLGVLSEGSMGTVLSLQLSYKSKIIPK